MDGLGLLVERLGGVELAQALVDAREVVQRIAVAAVRPPERLSLHAPRSLVKRL